MMTGAHLTSGKELHIFRKIKSKQGDLLKKVKTVDLRERNYNSSWLHKKVIKVSETVSNDISSHERVSEFDIAEKIKVHKLLETPTTLLSQTKKISNMFLQSQNPTE